METNKQKFIVRSANAGVFYGEIVNRNGNEVEMKDARCLWYWSGAASLNQLAMEGVKKPDNCKFTMEVSQATILNVCEILPCTDKAVECIDTVPVWRV